MKIIYCVIISVNPKCYYDEFMFWNGHYWVIDMVGDTKKLPCKWVKGLPFEAGELIVLDGETLREIGFPMRKPEKWGTEERYLRKDVEYKDLRFRYFTDIEKAVRFARKIVKKIQDLY